MCSQGLLCFRYKRYFAKNNCYYVIMSLFDTMSRINVIMLLCLKKILCLNKCYYVTLS